MAVETEMGARELRQLLKTREGQLREALDRVAKFEAFFASLRELLNDERSKAD